MRVWHIGNRQTGLSNISVPDFIVPVTVQPLASL